MISDSNNYLLKAFKIITIGDDDKQNFPGQERELNKTKNSKEHKKRLKKI